MNTGFSKKTSKSLSPKNEQQNVSSTFLPQSSAAMLPNAPSDGSYMGASIFTSAAALNQQNNAFRGGGVCVAQANPQLSLFPSLGGAEPLSFGPKPMSKLGGAPSLFGGMGMAMPKPMMPMAKQMPMPAAVQIVPSAIEEQQQSVEETIPVWIGPLSPNNTLISKCKAGDIFGCIVDTLETMVASKEMDFEKTNGSKYEVTGRVYGKYDTAEFCIALYRSDDRHSIAEDTIIEIKRTYGCGFAHNHVYQTISEQLYTKKLVERDDDDDIDMVTLTPFGNFSDFDLSELETESDGMMSSDDSLSTTSSIEEAQYHIGVISDRASFMEPYRASACHVASQSDNVDFMTAVETMDDNTSPLILSLLKPLCQDLFDTFIHIKILQIVHTLLRRGQVCQDSGNVCPVLQDLKQMWSEGVSRNVGGSDIRYIPSQTAVYWIEQCLKSLQSES